MERILKFSLTSFLLFLIAFSTVEAKELEGIFIKFDKRKSIITILTQQGKICLRFNSLSKEASEVLRILRQGYVVSLDVDNKTLEKIRIVEDPQ